MTEKEVLKIRCQGCGRTIAVDDKDAVEIKCHHCKNFTRLEKKLHVPKEQHLTK